MRLTVQASMLRSKKSHVIRMIIPKYDNRYFGSIAERFEEMARERGLLPIITLYAPASGTGDRSGKGDALLAGDGGRDRGDPIRIKFPRYASRRACQRSISTCRAPLAVR
ncbi:ribitol operon repressor [Klebsiella pneumoniae subsp. ozaenae]|uniref:Ribitol operon repressor n=1 Tax=Klebsiella pneumoniae subsp. ozaenae TaxID=574 RepID=A0A377ZZW4_KLEPO|nr:ribitol operon repressor [Klebsiella pneumoniae subsp. ozaenae]